MLVHDSSLARRQRCHGSSSDGDWCRFMLSGTSDGHHRGALKAAKPGFSPTLVTATHVYDDFRVEPNKGTQSFTGLLYYELYQYVRRLIALGFRRASLNILGTHLLRNSLLNMMFEKL
jgi:hypothetical protein